MSTTPDLSHVKIDGAHIEIELDGQLVTGIIVDRNSGDITVSITSPFEGISQQSGNVPIPLRQFKNYSGPAGDAKAAEILGELYRFCVYVEEHKKELLVTLAEYYEAVHYAKHLDPVMVSKKQRMYAISGELKEIKQSLKSGAIDKLAYQRQIGPLKKEMENLAFETEINTWEVYEHSFKAFAETPVGKIDQETVLSYLKPIT